MRTLRQLSVPQDGDNTSFPDGQIRNESPSQDGTPVVREIYGDMLVNIYKIIRDAGIDFTEDEDSEFTQYQLLDALKVFVNNTNDKERLITVNSTDMNVDLNFDNLPNKFVFIGKVTEDVSPLLNYTLNSAGTSSYPVNPTTKIAANSVVLVVLNSAGTTVIALSSGAVDNPLDFLTVNLGNPLSFNSSGDLLYYSKGDVLTPTPESFSVGQTIQGFVGTSDVKIAQVIALKGKLLCFTYNTANSGKYQMFAFDLEDLTTIEAEITLANTIGTDNLPYMYCDGEDLYFTNSNTQVNGSADNFTIGRFVFDETALTITSAATFNLDPSFQKTTNVFINRANQRLFTFINGTLSYFPADGTAAAPTQVGFFNTLNGQIFSFSGNIFYSNGETAAKWNY